MTKIDRVLAIQSTPKADSNYLVRAVAVDGQVMRSVHAPDRDAAVRWASEWATEYGCSWQEVRA